MLLLLIYNNNKKIVYLKVKKNQLLQLAFINKLYINIGFFSLTNIEILKKNL